MSRDDLPLRGVTLLDLAGVGPAARCVRVLADLGARWIRLAPPATAGRASAAWYAYGAHRGAEQMFIDLKAPGAAGTFLKLAQKVDIVVECFRPGVADRLGIGYAQVASEHAGIIYCSTTGFGQTGPYAQLAGHDLNYQALAGVLSCHERNAQGKPAMPGLTLADSAGGAWQAVIRILAALFDRTRTGRGTFLDVSATEGLLHLLSLAIDEHLAGPPTAGRIGTALFSGKFGCYNLYPAADGWMAVAALETKFFANLCEFLGVPELVPLQYEADAQQRIREALARCFQPRTRAEWMRALEGVDCCVTPVLGLDELNADAHWLARDAFVSYEHPRHGRVRQVAAFGGASADRGAPLLEGDDRASQILEAFDFTPPEIATLRLQGVLASQALG